MSRPRSRILKVLRLEPERRRRFFVAAAAVTLIAVMLRGFGYSGTISRLSRRLPRPEETADEAASTSHRIERDAWAVRAAGENLPWGSCLPRSVALWWLLARQSILTEIQFGVRRGDDDFSAHAWVEWRQRTISDPIDPRELYTHLGASS